MRPRVGPSTNSATAGTTPAARTAPTAANALTASGK